jgi:hypothetical protein
MTEIQRYSKNWKRQKFYQPWKVDANYEVE